MQNRLPWRVLVVDDEEGVHGITRMIFRGYEFEQRPIELISALSGAQAREQLAAHPDICLALIDVVMESDDEGLQLVNYIRETLDNGEMRLILRTGHPGFAPESEVIVRYDINDYLSKAELSASRLITSVLVALRSYRDIVASRRPIADAAQPAGDSAEAVALPVLQQSRQTLKRLQQLELSPMARDLVAQLACQDLQLQALYLQPPTRLESPLPLQASQPRSLLLGLVEAWLPLTRQQQRLVDLPMGDSVPEWLRLPEATRDLWNALLAHALLGNGCPDITLSLGFDESAGQLTLTLAGRGAACVSSPADYRDHWDARGRQRCEQLCRSLGGSLSLLADSDQELLLHASVAARVAD